MQVPARRVTRARRAHCPMNREQIVDVWFVQDKFIQFCWGRYFIEAELSDRIEPMLNSSAKGLAISTRDCYGQQIFGVDEDGGFSNLNHSPPIREILDWIDDFNPFFN